MKKIFALTLAAVLALACFALTSCSKEEKILVNTNAFFAPFEYYQGTEIIGVDVDIMNLVGEKLGKKVEFFNTEFGIIIDNVKEGKICDCGASGFTITEERKELVDFSDPYFTSVQYVIFNPTTGPIPTKTVDGKEYVVWDSLAGLKIGVQTDTTGWIYTDGEINARDGYDGVLYGTDTELLCYDSAQLAADAIASKAIDVVIVDQLPAEYIAGANKSLVAFPLYYSGDTDADDAPVEEQYAIAVTKGNTELLDAINEVLAELGKDGVEELIMKHMGF